MTNENNGTYYGRGNAAMYDDYMDFINYVFGFNGNTSDFKKLLPKLYRPEDDPAGHSYVVTENGKIKAAVGAFDLSVSVGGELLHTRGIGNVAVHPYARSRGYMRRLMNDAVDDMIRDGIDYTTLGGRRQRYNYFSYDKLGSKLNLTFTSDNIRHVFGQPRCHSIKLKKLTPDDTAALDSISALYGAQPLHALRDRARLFDILTSWSSSVWCGYDGDAFVGYAVVGGDCSSELFVTDEGRLCEFVAALFDTMGRGKLGITLPPYMPNYAGKLYRIAEGYTVDPDKSFSVLNYERTVRAFMRLRAQCMGEMPDGELTLLIHGRGGDENITLSVSRGDVDVRATNKTPAGEYSHLDAMDLLFAPICPARDSLPYYARMWLPLPIFIHYVDAV